MRGHYWTLATHVRHMWSPQKPPASRHWSTRLDDPVRGEVQLTGRYSPADDSDALVVLVHGLGGSYRSAYMLAAAQVVNERGLASLRINLRGADRRGDDWYHAGLIADLQAVLNDALVRAFARVHLIGFSMGGHVSLALAARTDLHVASLASICAPLDLEAGANAIDQPRGALYRRHVLNGLKDIYREAARNNPVPTPVSDAMKITTLREWDSRVIAPRFGFDSAEHYWHTQSAGPILDRIDVPTLAVVTRHDPMVFLDTLRPFIGKGSIRWSVIDGGHVGFADGVDLGVGERGSVIEQVVGWSCDPR